MGLMAIFSAAPIPIAIMGISLGVGKLVIASWVKAYWEKAPLLIKSYGVVSVCILMMITTLGCFGYLSKAHSDQTLVSGDVQAKIAIYDERIKTEKDNIEADRKQIAQMDAAVDQILSRSDDEKGASKANEIRRSQLRDRSRLQNEILESQKKIATIQDERAPFAAENRKVEAEVGPIKYIAAFVYGANPDANILERAVTWVIILIVVVFDPLAVVMLLAAQMTFQWVRDDKTQREVLELGEEQNKLYSELFPTLDEAVEQAREEDYGDCSKCGTKLSNAPGIGPFCPNKECDVVDGVNLPEHQPGYVELTPFTVTDTADLDSVVDVVKPMLPDPKIQHLQDRIVLVEQDRDDLIEFVKQNQDDYNKITELHNRSMHREMELTQEIDRLHGELSSLISALEEAVQQQTIQQPEPVAEVVPEPELDPVVELTLEPEIVTIVDNVTVAMPETAPRFKAEQQEVPATAPRPKGIVAESVPEPVPQVPVARNPSAGFGSDFPTNPERGDMFLRTDFKPTRLFKWNDIKWIEINKGATDAYTYNDAYIQYLAEKLFNGEYSIEDLSDVEQQQIQAIMANRHA
jgi:hypothetical protein